MITSVLFDLDDLMISSSVAHFKAYEMALKEFGLALFNIPENLRSEIYGLRIKEIMELLVEHFNMDVDIDKLTSKRNDIFLSLVKKGIDPMPGLDKITKNVNKWGLKKALATSGIKDYVSEILKQLKLTDYFDAVVTGDEVKNSKPAPDTFLAAAKKLKVPQSECVVLEDSMHGITAAKRAGMRAIGVRNSIIDTKQDLSKADVIVNRLDQITREMVIGR